MDAEQRKALEELRVSMPDQADAAVTEVMQRSHRLSIGAEPASPGAASAASEPEEAPPVLTMRTSSFAVMQDLAKSRINTFKQAQETREKAAEAAHQHSMA